MSSGVRISSTPIAIDLWKPIKGVSLYFLTHMHADHTRGLTPTWDYGTIYCTEVTKVLLMRKLGVAEELIVGLELDTPHTIPLSRCGSTSMRVTLIDANHCPGAAMVLMQGPFGNILHTGDFRATEAMPLHPALRDTEIDILYLDNTYGNPKYTLPPREEATEQILNVIESHMEDVPLPTFEIGLDRLGKEELIQAMSDRFEMYVYVEPGHMFALDVAGVEDVVSHDPADSCLHVVSKRQISHKRLAKWNANNPNQPRRGILPSGWTPWQNGNSTLVDIVPYSLHSSYTELEAFVAAIRPTVLVPVVNDDAGIAAVNTTFARFLSGRPLPPIVDSVTPLEGDVLGVEDQLPPRLTSGPKAPSFTRSIQRMRARRLNSGMREQLEAAREAEQLRLLDELDEAESVEAQARMSVAAMAATGVVVSSSPNASESESGGVGGVKSEVSTETVGGAGVIIPQHSVKSEPGLVGSAVDVVDVPTVSTTTTATQLSGSGVATHSDNPTTAAASGEQATTTNTTTATATATTTTTAIVPKQTPRRRWGRGSGRRKLPATLARFPRTPPRPETQRPAAVVPNRISAVRSLAAAIANDSGLESGLSTTTATTATTMTTATATSAIPQAETCGDASDTIAPNTTTTAAAAAATTAEVESGSTPPAKTRSIATKSRAQPKLSCGHTSRMRGCNHCHMEAAKEAARVAAAAVRTLSRSGKSARLSSTKSNTQSTRVGVRRESTKTKRIRETESSTATTSGATTTATVASLAVREGSEGPSGHESVERTYTPPTKRKRVPEQSTSTKQTTTTAPATTATTTTESVSANTDAGESGGDVGMEPQAKRVKKEGKKSGSGKLLQTSIRSFCH